MDKDQRQRIERYEGIMFEAIQMIKEYSEEKAGPLRERMKDLEDYYGSAEWRQDFEDDEAGLLPEDLKRGVLSEDGIYNLVEQYRELLE